MGHRRPQDDRTFGGTKFQGSRIANFGSQIKVKKEFPRADIKLKETQRGPYLGILRDHLRGIK